MPRNHRPCRGLQGQRLGASCWDFLRTFVGRNNFQPVRRPCDDDGERCEEILLFSVFFLIFWNSRDYQWLRIVMYFFLDGDIYRAQVCFHVATRIFQLSCSYHSFFIFIWEHFRTVVKSSFHLLLICLSVHSCIGPTYTFLLWP